VAERLASKEKSVKQMEELYRKTCARYQQLHYDHEALRRRIEQMQARLDFLSGWRQHSAAMLARSQELLMRESVTEADRALAQTLKEVATEIRIAGGGAAFSNPNQDRPGIQYTSDDRDLKAGGAAFSNPWKGRPAIRKASEERYLEADEAPRTLPDFEDEA